MHVHIIAAPPSPCLFLLWQVPFLYVLPLRILLVYSYTGFSKHHLSLYSWGLGIMVGAKTGLRVVLLHARVQG